MIKLHANANESIIHKIINGHIIIYAVSTLKLIYEINNGLK